MSLIEDGEAPPVIVVAEDDPSASMLLQMNLEVLGCEVVSVADGDAAVAAALEVKPDVVMLDVDMPGKDGFEVLAALKASDDEDVANAPVVFVTAHGQTVDIVNALRDGAHDHLAKPYDPQELRARVQAAIRVKRLQDQLRQANNELLMASRTDALTGLVNRRQLEESLASYVRASRRHERDFAIAIVDVDHFKHVNDNYGHAVGDEILKTVAAEMRDEARESDVVGRWGGEEFLVLMPETTREGGIQAADRLRDAVAKKATTVGTVTVSIGVAAIRTAGRDSMSELLTRADGALYQAKSDGRNRVVAASEVFVTD